MAYYLEPQANDLSKLNNGNTQDVLGDVNSSCNKIVPRGKGSFKLQSLSTYCMPAVHTSGTPKTLQIKMYPTQAVEKSPDKSLLIGVRSVA